LLDSVSEPSHSLCDLGQAMFEENIFRHVELTKCTSRCQEINNQKVEPSAATDKQGFFKLNAELEDSYKIRQAFTRRSLALDQANLVTFGIGEIWANMLFRAYSAQQPPGVGTVSMDQIIQTDRELSVLLVEACRAGIQPVGGVRPLDTAIQGLLYNPRLATLLLPRVHHASSSSSSRVSGKGDHAGPSPWKVWKQDQKAKGKGKSFSPKGKGKGAGPKGKGKGKFSMPPGLENCWQKINGQNACYGFNLGTCEECEVGKSCSKGLHLCCTPRCGGKHPHISCPKR
jgi:hypothetical protein